MKKLFIILVLFTSLKCYAQNKADAIIGKWLKIPKEDMIIEVYKSNKEYKGKIIWTKTIDKKKPVGFIILDGLNYDTKSKKWETGKIHDPASGSTYTASATIKSDGTLEVKGYMRMKFLGSKRYFRKIK